MSFEQQPSIDVSKETETTNNIQMEIIKNHPEWIDNIEQNGETFRNYINNHPELIEKYQEDPEAVVAEVEKVFYH